MLLGSVCRDVVREMPKGAEDLLVFFAVGTELNAIVLGDNQGDLKNVDRIQTEPVPIERGPRINLGGGQIEVQGGNDEIGNLALQSCVVSRRRRLSERRRFVGHKPQNIR